MTHPEDLLAEYVDGTLSGQERAVVDEHLSTCPTCREEVASATRAVEALASLPDVPVPFGVTEPVLAEARRLAHPTPKPARARLQWVAGLAAAACLVLVAVVVVPRLTGGRDGGSAVRAPAAEAGAGQEGLEGAAMQATPGLEVLDEDLDDRDARRLAKGAAREALATPQVTDQAVATPNEAADQALAEPNEAVACLVASGGAIDDRHVLVRLLEARYVGTAAYFGVFHEGPGGGRPPERVVVWVVSKSDCAILTLLSQNV